MDPVNTCSLAPSISMMIQGGGGQEGGGRPDAAVRPDVWALAAPLAYRTMSLSPSHSGFMHVVDDCRGTGMHQDVLARVLTMPSVRACQPHHDLTIIHHGSLDRSQL